jgi:hypothetical protein
VCKTVASPSDSHRCANQLIPKYVDVAVPTFSVFGNHDAINNVAGVPVVTITSITIADFVAQGVLSVGGGGGRLGAPI